MIPDKKTRPKELHVTSGDTHVSFKDLHATRSGQRVSPSHVWLPPEHHDVKINVDAGFSKVSDRAATTVVCRDKRGNYLGASAIIYDGRLDPTILEAQACCEALSLALDLQVQSICVASDCLEVVLNIQDEVPCRYFSILQDIKHERSHFQDVKFLHENRKHNGEAHALAKAAASLSPGRHVWLSISLLLSSCTTARCSTPVKSDVSRPATRRWRVAM